jgi:hypothetical protein
MRRKGGGHSESRSQPLQGRIEKSHFLKSSLKNGEAAGQTLKRPA